VNDNFVSDANSSQSTLSNQSQPVRSPSLSGDQFVQATSSDAAADAAKSASVSPRPKQNTTATSDQLNATANMSTDTYDSSYEMEEEEEDHDLISQGGGGHQAASDISFEDKSATLRPAQQQQQQQQSAQMPTSATFPSLDEERNIMLKINQSIDLDPDGKHINRVYSDKSIYYSSVSIPNCYFAFSKNSELVLKSFIEL
jgi:hypothetical protein